MKPVVTVRLGEEMMVWGTCIQLFYIIRDWVIPRRKFQAQIRQYPNILEASVSVYMMYM